MNDPDRMTTWRSGQGNDLPESLWAYDGLPGGDDSPAVNITSGFTSLGFIKAAIRRRAWLWCLLAVVGLLIGQRAVQGISSRLPGLDIGPDYR